ncbi:MAG: L,D-transpeptidase family protein [Bacteroidia bacterium]|nr:L,D-transpeptidase family protein [Bacteroidia bacterium]
MKFIPLFFLVMAQSVSFKEAQLKNVRVKSAYQEKESVVKSYFANKKLNYSGFQLFIRAFKKEQSLEIWIKEKNVEEFALLRTYAFCSTSGTLGPKRKEGDLQIPEGIYYLNHFNPVSNFHLSLGVNYPNASDKILSDKQNPGGSIYIHGNCVTIGCIPITDDKIKELYLLSVEAKNNGQEKIPIHIFPDRLYLGTPEKLIQEYSADEKVASFWKNLQTIYVDFNVTKKLKLVRVNEKGEYQLR